MGDQFAFSTPKSVYVYLTALETFTHTCLSIVNKKVKQEYSIDILVTVTLDAQVLCPPYAK